VVRSGRRLRLVDAELVQDDVVKARASLLSTATSASSGSRVRPGGTGTSDPVLDALPPEDARWFSETAGWTTTATAHRNNARKVTWLLPTEIVAGEKPTPFQHVAAAASGTKALIRSLEFQDGLVLVVDRQIRGGHDPSPKTHSGKPIDDGARCGPGQPGLHRGLGDLPGPAFDQWGWRVLFFCGLLSALLSLFVLRKVEDHRISRGNSARRWPSGSWFAAEARRSSRSTSRWPPVVVRSTT
jgi:hypothetical protein